MLGRPLGGTEENDLFNDAVIPNFYLSHRLNDRIVLGLGVTAPFGLATEYNQDSVTRFQSVKSSLKVAEINPSIGYQVNDRLSVALAFRRSIPKPPSPTISTSAPSASASSPRPSAPRPASCRVVRKAICESLAMTGRSAGMSARSMT